MSKEDTIEYEAVFNYASKGDICASYLLEHSLKIWAVTALNLVHAYDPEIVILGGGIMASGEIIMPVIQKYINEHAWNPWEKPAVIQAIHGNSAALLACEWLLKEKLGLSI